LPITGRLSAVAIARRGLKGRVSSFIPLLNPGKIMQVQYYGITMNLCDGVYLPSEDTFLMMRSSNPGHNILEIGCGSGLVSIHFAKLGRRVTAVDISDAAVACTLLNSKLNGVSVSALKSDLFSRVKGKFNTILFNPPYLPTEDNVPEGIQWNGGEGGIEVVSRFLGEADRHLEKDGDIYLVLSSLSDIDALESQYVKYSFEKIDGISFFYEKLYLYRLTIQM